MSSNAKQETPETYDDLVKVLSALNEKMAARDLYLKAFERLVMAKVFSKQITLYNIASQRKIGLRSEREGAMLNLQVKIMRRNLFLLRVRAFEIQERIERLRDQTLRSPAENPPPEKDLSDASGVSEGEIDNPEAQPALQTA